MNIRRFQFIVFSCVVSAGIFFYLFTRVSLDEVLSAVGNLDPAWLAYFLLFSLLMSIFRTWRYHLLLATSGFQVKKIPLFLVTLVRNFFSDLLPARLGTLIYVYLIRTRLNVPLAPAVSSFAYAFIFDILALAVMLVPAVLLIGGITQSGKIVLVAGGILGIICIVIVYCMPGLSLWSAYAIERLTFLPPSWRSWLTSELRSLRDHFLKVREQGLYWHILALSLCVRLCKYLGLYVLLLGLVLPLGYTVGNFPFPKVFLGLCSAELAASLPISGIAGFGAYEGAWAMVFQMLGYSEKLAVLTSISHHLITQIYGYSLGGLALLVLVLPFFREDGDMTIVSGRSSAAVAGQLFWFKFVASVAAAVLICLFLLPGGAKTVRQARAEPVPGEAATSSLLIAGKVVYQRADGIYMTEINAGITEKLVSGGTYPRWSPDGEQVAYVSGNDIMLFDQNDKKSRKLVTAGEARAVCFREDGKAVLFTDGKSVREVEIATGTTRTLIKGNRFFEIDIAAGGRQLTVTEKSLTGYRVRIYDLKSSEAANVARGCSASFSPNGKLVTVNGGDHTFVQLYGVEDLQERGRIPSPQGQRFDNHFWSNHRDWLVSTVEGKATNIYIHHVPTGNSRKVTDFGDCDRADLFIFTVSS
ncbi:lysylphosphatidylglycerol synthase domain-containing protein [Desulfosediminicola sp.]|uniref:lysylphosphatidylglycerol synthase domain-containing protein n=1 Tax=Desulfosediminicola sp. TaxID=2886825 RepID=UPI003AF24EED